ncbi:MAG: HAD family hydrolase [bacterium]|nr:HAD family hydrolase [bacterium]
MPEVVLFDLDETLINRTESIQRYAERFQGDFNDALVATSGVMIADAIIAADERGYRPREALFAALRQSLGWLRTPDIICLQKHWNKRFPLSSVARQGLEETLMALTAMGIRLGVVTNGVVHRQQDKIEHLKIGHYLSTVVISEAVQINKPDPRIFALALNEMNCRPSGAWFVGDHPVNDVFGASAAGLRPIWLSGVHAWPEGHPLPQDQISSLIEVVQMVQQANDPEA